jgi:hypothetical protein
VDGELDRGAAAAVGAHLETCPACCAQAAAERELRARLRGLALPEPPAGLEARVRSRARRPSPLGRTARWALPLAAVLVIGVGLRGHAPLVAWELSRDHEHCFSTLPLPAKVRSGEPRVIAEWFEGRGAYMPAVPDRVGELALIGARYCALPDGSSAPHVYYASASRHLSLFVVPHAVRLDGRFAGVARGRPVRLLRLEGEVVGIVAESEADVQAFETTLRPILAARAALGRARR